MSVMPLPDEDCTSTQIGLQSGSGQSAFASLKAPLQSNMISVTMFGVLDGFESTWVS